MHAAKKRAAWSWFPRRRRKGRGNALGFVLYEPGRRPGLPARVANAHARFEDAARAALRDWLML